MKCEFSDRIRNKRMQLIIQGKRKNRYTVDWNFSSWRDSNVAKFFNCDFCLFYKTYIISVMWSRKMSLILRILILRYSKIRGISFVFYRPRGRQGDIRVKCCVPTRWRLCCCYDYRVDVQLQNCMSHRTRVVPTRWWPLEKGWQPYCFRNLSCAHIFPIKNLWVEISAKCATTKYLHVQQSKWNKQWDAPSIEVYKMHVRGTPFDFQGAWKFGSGKTFFFSAFGHWVKIECEGAFQDFSQVLFSFTNLKFSAITINKKFDLLKKFEHFIVSSLSVTLIRTLSWIPSLIRSEKKFVEHSNECYG